MGEYILCQIKRAKIPYYIESISTNIFSIEELCFYLYHNVYLIDETIINELLCDWIRDELGLTKLYVRLYEHLDKEESFGNFILPIFKEINYLSHKDFQQLQDKITEIEMLPPEERKKLKADYLVNNEMYTHAIAEYYHILHGKTVKDLGNRLYTSVWANMGCAYAKMFLFEEAAICFKEAYKVQSIMSIYEKYLCAIKMTMTDAEFEEKIEAGSIDLKLVSGLAHKMDTIAKNAKESDLYQWFLQVKAKKDAEDVKEYEQDMRELLYKLTKDYHRGTCS